VLLGKAAGHLENFPLEPKREGATRHGDLPLPLFRTHASRGLHRHAGCTGRAQASVHGFGHARLAHDRTMRLHGAISPRVRQPVSLGLFPARR
jgi:hypothetical protein